MKGKDVGESLKFQLKNRTCVIFKKVPKIPT